VPGIQAELSLDWARQRAQHAPVGFAGHASFELHHAGRLPALVDDAGEPVAATELPCCVEPDNWTADAPIETRRRSARRCAYCPALTSCEQIRVALGDDARGVLAGHDCVRTYEATCEMCGAEFTAHAHHGRYCSDECRNAVHNATVRAKRLSASMAT